MSMRSHRRGAPTLPPRSCTDRIGDLFPGDGLMACMVMFALFGTTGCSSAQVERIETRAHFELECAREQLDVLELSPLVYAAVGCGKKAFYVCEEFGMCALDYIDEEGRTPAKQTCNPPQATQVPFGFKRTQPHHFLPLIDDEQLWHEYWCYFRYAEAEAISFTTTPETWPEIRLIVHSDRAIWFNHGLIEVPVHHNNIGAVFHELFHNVHYLSPLHEGGDEDWGEAFSNAFRYVIENKLELQGARAPWRADIEAIIGTSYEEAVARFGESRWLTGDIYPTALILKDHHTLEQLRQLWFMLTEKRIATGADVISKHFGYSPQTGPMP